MQDLRQGNKKYLKARWIQFRFKAYDWYRTYILKEQDCDNCKYFGGLMCVHVDKQNKCLGWERYKWHPIKDLKRKIQIKRLSRKMRKKL